MSEQQPDFIKPDIDPVEEMKKEINIYNRFDESKLKSISRLFRGRLKKKRDVVAVIDGEEGESKSTLAVKLATRINPKFRINSKYVMFNPSLEEVFHKVTEAPEGTVFILDEAISILYKLNWNTSEQKKINELFTKCRKERKVFLLCIPRFTDLNEYFRKHRIMFRFYVPMRGYTQVCRKASIKDVKDPFYIDINLKKTTKQLKGRAPYEVPQEEYIRILRKDKGFLTDFRFNALMPDQEKLYDALTENKYEGFLDSNKSASRRVVENAVLRMLVKENMKYKQIGEEIGLSEQQIKYIAMVLKREGRYAGRTKEVKADVKF